MLRSALLLSLAWNVCAQPSDEGTNLVVDTWQIETGLPNNSVTALLQTQDRYLWVGTSNGLARFDGVRFTTFRALDHPGLKSNRILCLAEDLRGILWIGTQEGGLTSFSNGQFASLTTAEGLSSDTVSCLGTDQAGRLWAGTASGLNRWADGRLEAFFRSDGLPDDRVFAVLQPTGTPMLFATGKGLARFSGQRVVEAPGALRNAVFALVQGRDGQLWAGGESGLHCWPDARGTAALRLTSQPVLCLIVRQSGQIWFGTSAGALCRVFPGGGPGEPETIWHFSSAVAALREDLEGNLWVGTAGDGLHRLKPRQLRLIPPAEGLGVNAAAGCFETSAGELRFVAGDRGLYSCQEGRIALLERLPLPANVVVQTAAGLRDGQVWIGTQGDGLFDCLQGSVTRISERDGLSDNAVQALYAEEDGGVWIGTRNGGLNYFKGGTVTRFNTPWGFSGNFACVLAKDRHDSLWIGTTGDGLFHLAAGRFARYTEADGLPSSQIRALHADPDGVVWVGTSKGLCRVKEGRVTAFPGRSGLANEAILQLRSDREGNLWLGSSSGIFRASKAQLNACAEQGVGFLVALPFGKEDGLPTLQCLPGISAQPKLSGEGRVWFLTSKGLVLGEQHGWQANQSPPSVVLEQLLVENQSVPLNEAVRVAPGKESLQFQYTALSLTAPEKLCFRYQLAGFDRDWSEPSAGRVARYSRLPPGEYRFRVAACNNDGVWNEAGAGVGLVVLPFWWATTWFRLTAVAASAGLMGGLYRLRQARRREIERLRVRIASDLHDDVGSSLWSITLLSRMLVKHGEMGPQERQDLGEINRIAIQTSNSIRDIIWLINPAFASLQDLLLRTKDFAGTVLHGVDYRVHSEGLDLSKKLPLDFRQHLFLFFKEALTNIARHASATVVEVRIERHNDRWRLSIRDNGVGFDPAAGTSGNGLRNLRARAAKMGAALEIRSQPGQGTTLIFTTTPP